MSTACASTPPTVAANAWAEMVASLANMVESALTGDGLTGDGPGGDGLSGVETAAGPAGRGVVRADAVGVAADDPGRVEGERGASGTGGDRLRPPVDADAGPRAHRIDHAPVRPGRAGGPAGLAGSDIEVIDSDLGLSGRSATHRDGFKALVARVCLGEVGAVFGLEVSRLARSNADLARLLELARLTDTLVIDNDGVYDLSDIDDAQLLGMKSQMSEAELHWLTSRLQESKRAAAARGELRVPLPVGFVYNLDSRVIIDPDAEVAAAIGDVFAAFAQTGSAYGVAGAFAGRRFPRRAYGGAWAGQLRSASPCPRGRDSAQPGLCRRLRVRSPPHPPGRARRRLGPHLDPRTAAGPVGSAHQRPSSRLHHLATSRPTRPNWPPTAPTPGPAHHGKAPRCVRASCSAAPAGAACRSASRPVPAL